MIKLWAEDATADFTEFRKEWEKEKRQVVADISASIEKMLGVKIKLQVAIDNRSEKYWRRYFGIMCGRIKQRKVKERKGRK